MRSHGRHSARMALPVEPIYEEPVYYEDLPGPEEVLYSGSDDEYYESPAERRQRYEVQAQRYLDGKPLLIISASLKGPFTKESGWENPWRSRTAARKSRRPGTPEEAPPQLTSTQVDACPVLDDSDQLDSTRAERGEPIVRIHERSNAARQRDTAQSTQPISTKLPRTMGADPSRTPASSYIDDAAWVRIRAWRDEVRLKAPSREEFWVPNPPPADQWTPARKKRATGPEWLRRKIAKRRKLEIPGIYASPSPALYPESLPDAGRTRSTPPSSTPDYAPPGADHAGNVLQKQRSSSSPKSVEGQCLVQGLPDADSFRDTDTAEMFHRRPYDFHISDMRRSPCKEGRSQGAHLSSAVVPDPCSPRDIIVDIEGEEKDGHCRSVPSVGLSPSIQVDQSFEYRRNPRQEAGASVAAVKPSIAGSPTRPTADSDSVIAKTQDNRSVEVEGRGNPQNPQNGALASRSHIPGVLLEPSQALDTTQDEGFDDGQAALDDGTSDGASLIDGPTLVPPSTFAEVEAQGEKSNSGSEDPRAARQGNGPSESDDCYEARETVNDTSQRAELRGRRDASTEPTITRAVQGSALQLEGIPKPSSANDDKNSSTGSASHVDNGSVFLPISQEAWGLGIEQDSECDAYAEQGTHSRPDASTNIDVHASPGNLISIPEPYRSSDEEMEKTTEHDTAEPDTADGIIIMEFDESRLPAQEPSKVRCPSSPGQRPPSQRRGIPDQQQSPWVEELVDIPYIPSLAEQPTLLSADCSRLPYNASQTEPSTHLPTQRPSKPPSSRASNDGPLGVSIHTLAEPPLECDRDATMASSQAHDNPPSTPETKRSSLPTPDFTLSIKSFREFITPSPVRHRRPKRVSLQNGQLPSTQVLFNAALSNPWKSTRKSGRRVSFAPLPGEAAGSHNQKLDPVDNGHEGAELAAYDATEPTTGHCSRTRTLSPPLNISQTEFPAENTRFGKHFATVARKGPQVRRPKQVQRLLPSASQQVCGSPGFDAMAEAFITADHQGSTHEEEARLEKPDASMEEEEEEEEEEGEKEDEGADGVDDIREVLENLDEFLNSFDVDIELERARADGQGAAMESPVHLGGLGNHMDSSMGVNAWD